MSTPSQRLGLPPSVGVLISGCAVVSLWAAHQGGNDPRSSPTARKRRWIPPELAAPLAAGAEHLFPLLIGLATRFSALALLAMTLTIQLFVYPDAYPTHGVWAAVLLFLFARGPGAVSLDHWLARHYAV